MITPSPNAVVPEYYKIGDNVEFAWNYTALLAKPTAVDVLVSCGGNQATYTILANDTFKPTGRAVWNTSVDEHGVAPLLTESYTLIIHDVDADITENAKPGHLATYNQFHFGMYLKQSYLSIEGGFPALRIVMTVTALLTRILIDGWVCATCSGALSDMERQTLKFVFGMAAITVFSFTWFAGGFGLF